MKTLIAALALLAALVSGPVAAQGQVSINLVAEVTTNSPDNSALAPTPCTYVYDQNGNEFCDPDSYYIFECEAPNVVGGPGDCPVPLLSFKGGSGYRIGPYPWSEAAASYYFPELPFVTSCGAGYTCCFTVSTYVESETGAAYASPASIASNVACRSF